MRLANLKLTLPRTVCSILCLQVFTREKPAAWRLRKLPPLCELSLAKTLCNDTCGGSILPALAILGPRGFRLGNCVCQPRCGKRDESGWQLFGAECSEGKQCPPTQAKPRMSEGGPCVCPSGKRETLSNAMKHGTEIVCFAGLACVGLPDCTSPPKSL